MAIREILLPLVSYPVAIEEAAIKKSVSVAAHLNAQILAVSFEVDARPQDGTYTRPFSTRFTMEAPEHKPSVENAEQMMAVLEAAAREAGVGYRKAITRCAPEDFSSYLAHCARTIDLSLVPIRSYDEMHEKVVEGLIFQSGRPLLIFSEGGADRLPNSFEHAAIAWDHSQQATRAVADAMPFLQGAKTVTVFTVTDKETPTERESGEALVKHLAAHGITAGFEVIPKGGASIGKVFEAYVQKNAIDLLVMGAYRHSRLREFFMPGATYTVVGSPPCWVLMTH
ncbi:universal stress protein [Bradyrhizobium lablabi]|nr:universal stress protein [Bradyrhizobium lablabi]